MIDAQQLKSELEEHWVLTHHEFCNHDYTKRDDDISCTCYVRGEAVQRDRILALVDSALAERDDLAQRLKRVEQGLWDIGRERDELLQALHPRGPE